MFGCITPEDKTLDGAIKVTFNDPELAKNIFDNGYEIQLTLFYGKAISPGLGIEPERKRMTLDINQLETIVPLEAQVYDSIMGGVSNGPYEFFYIATGQDITVIAGQTSNLELELGK